MARTVKHFSLHRIGGTELRVVSDVASGVLPLVEAEEAVIEGYTDPERMAGLPPWPHRWVTLLIMQDMQPLIRQLTPSALRQAERGGQGEGASLPPGGASALDQRPVVNVYDLANPDACHVFVNHQAMVQAGYWHDLLAARGLLAHEHAHPLAENETIRSSRQVQLDLRFTVADSRLEEYDTQIGNRKSRIVNVLALLADELSVYAPREVFANELTICSRFGDALLHLDRQNVANAAQGVTGRGELCQQLQQEVTEGMLTQPAADLLLLIGDLRGFLNLALEVAPFYRTGQKREARELEAALETAVFPYVEPQVAVAYRTLRDRYIALCADLSPSGFVAWSEGVLNVLAGVLAEKGLLVEYYLRTTGGRKTESVILTHHPPLVTHHSPRRSHA
jgi:hypothetical protein